jgi:prevent-host-death family protein
MKLTATEAKREFGNLILKAQSEPVRVLRNGKPVVAVISNEDYELFETLKANQLKKALSDGMNDLAEGKIQDSGSVFDELMDLATE